MKALYKLSSRIFATFALALILLSSVFGVLASHYGEKMVVESSSNELRVLTVVLSQLIQKQFSSLENSIDLITEDPIIAESIESRKRNSILLMQYLIDQRARYQLFDDIMIYDEHGLCIGSTDQDWFKIAGKGIDFFENGLVEFNFPSIYGTETAGKVQLVSAPIYNEVGATVGVIVAIIRLNAVYDLMEQEIGLTENRDAFLLDSDLRFITPGKVGPQELVESHLAGTTLKQHLRDESWVGEYLNYDGVKVQGTVLKIPGYSWYVVVERKFDGVVQQITSIKRVILIVTATLLLLFIAASLILSRSITLPLMRLVAATRRMGTGDLSLPIENRTQYEEVDVLAAEFERMRLRVARSQDQLIEKLEQSENLRIESERLAAIGTLAATLAHEIRNPLNAMNLLVSRIGSKVKSDDLLQLTRDIGGEISRLDRLVNSILDYARPLQLNKEVCELNEIIVSVVSIYKDLLNQAKVTVTFRFLEKLMVDIDRDQFKQCMLNAIQNSMEAMPDGGHIDILLDL
ncbi:MAG: sensor histidine kinase, partial [Proteobacteria bacterium]|nr:sensor histidine kinase [Pseudomonadota bacterium]